MPLPVVRALGCAVLLVVNARDVERTCGESMCALCVRSRWGSRVRVRTVEVALPQHVFVAAGPAECELQERVQAGMGEGELQQSAGGGGAEREESGRTQQLHGREVCHRWRRAL